MQDYYNSISATKRIAFVDNLTDEQAKTLSNKYPNAVCFASNTSENTYPVIWFNKQRYGFTKIDKTLLSIGDVMIGLTIDETGTLKLTSNIVIDDYELNAINVLYNSDFSYNWAVDTNNIIEQNGAYSLYSLNNLFLLTFNFKKDGDIVTDKNYNITFSESQYYSITETTYNNNIAYRLAVTKDYTNSTPLTITTSIAVNNSTITKYINIFPRKLPHKCNWVLNNNTVNSGGNDASTYISPNSNFNLQFNFDGLGYFDPDKYSIKLFKVNSSTGLIIENAYVEVGTNSNINNNDNNYIINQWIGDSQSVKIRLRIYERAANHTGYFCELSNSTLEIKLTEANKLFYIGNISTIPQIVTTNEITEVNNSQILNSWHYIGNYNFNDINAWNIPVNPNTQVILPQEYGLYLPIYNDIELTDPIEDNMWVKQNNTRTINGDIYNVYNCNCTDITNPRFLSIIKSSN